MDFNILIAFDHMLVASRASSIKFTHYISLIIRYRISMCEYYISIDLFDGCVVYDSCYIGKSKSF